MRYLLLVAMLTVALPIYGQKESGKPNDQQNGTKSPEKTPSAAVTQSRSKAQSDNAAADSESYLSRL